VNAGVVQTGRARIAASRDACHRRGSDDSLENYNLLYKRDSCKNNYFCTAVSLLNARTVLAMPLFPLPQPCCILIRRLSELASQTQFETGIHSAGAHVTAEHKIFVLKMLKFLASFAVENLRLAP
jgi:hypothetical protein